MKMTHRQVSKANLHSAAKRCEYFQIFICKQSYHFHPRWLWQINNRRYYFNATALLGYDRRCAVLQTTCV